jgi:hypothetical protein
MNNALRKLAEEMEEAGEHEEAAHLHELAEEQDGTSNVTKSVNKGGGEEQHVITVSITGGSEEELLKSLQETLTEIADKLDAKGEVKEANLVDGLLMKLAAKAADPYDADKNNKETFKANKPKKKTEIKHHNPAYQETGEKGLSSRYCPEHLGVMLARVGERMYECSLDGKRYNYDDMGSVANQTPSASNVSVPSRLFDPREDVINKIN